MLGYICRASEEMDKAISHFQRALDIVQEAGEQGRIVRQLNALGCAYSAKRDWPVAEGYFQQAIDTARIGHLVHWEIISCINLAEMAGTFGEMALAEAHYHVAAGVDRSQEDTFLNVLVAYGSGKAKLLQGDVSVADQSFRKVLKDAVETGNRRIMKYSMQALAVCAIQSGQLERAIRLRGVIISRDWLLWPMEMPWLVPYDLDGLLVQTRDTLGEDEYARLTAESQVMTLEQAVAYALGVQNE